MNIQEAKEQIERTVQIYLMKDSFGNYRIPLERQRPVFLLGAPGIGKTAIMEQVAADLDLALVSYSMTHHTRQSALGLPLIKHRKYQGTEFDVSEYTMSEIIASVYEAMEKTGKKEGILFLDEINCVSETLAPSMLQFLQYKTFGMHQIPKGWVVATAGNPPQFNRSVREFDIVTLDRLKVLEIEADYTAWRGYAINRGVHGAIITYLDIKKNDFYVIENTVDGKTYVTARGWEDLSEILSLYEENGFPVDETLVSQYIRNKRIARDFAAYYDLYRKYRQDYRIQGILSGEADHEICNRAKKAGFDERISLIGLLLDAIQLKIRKNIYREDTLRRLLSVLKEVKQSLGESADWNEQTAVQILKDAWESLEQKLEQEDEAHSMGKTTRTEYQKTIQILQEDAKAVRMAGAYEPSAAFALIKERFESDVNDMKAEGKQISQELSNLFKFVEKIFGQGNEMLILVTDLTVNGNSAKFISRWGSHEYEKYNKKFQIYERQQEIADAVEKLQL